MFSRTLRQRTCLFTLGSLLASRGDKGDTGDVGPIWPQTVERQRCRIRLGYK